MTLINKKTLLKLLGYLFLLLAGIGIILPLLPTTPFVLVAAMCFAKSSPEIHEKLINHRFFGPILRDWEEKRCMNCKVKLFAMGSVVSFTGLSIFLVKSIIAKVIGALLLLIALIVMARIPTCKTNKESPILVEDDIAN